MNIRRLTYGLLLTTATALVACGEPAQPETPQGGTTTAAETPTAVPTAVETTPPPPGDGDRDGHGRGASPARPQAGQGEVRRQVRAGLQR